MTDLLKNQRIELVDALRGFAILAIILLHNMEHFEFYYSPEQLPEWLKVLEKQKVRTLAINQSALMVRLMTKNHLKKTGDS